MLRKKIFLVTGSLLLLTLSSKPLKAQFFGISLDSAIAYSVAKKSVVGGVVGITHPIPLIPNFGYSTLVFEEVEEQESNDKATQVEMDTKIKLSTINIFYNVPFPVVSMSLGFGYGTLTPTTKVTKTVSGTGTNNDTTELSVPVTEGFLHVGLPFWNFIEFHIGYHAFSATAIQRNKKSTIDISDISGVDFENANYSGGMMTIGIQFAF